MSPRTLLLLLLAAPLACTTTSRTDVLVLDGGAGAGGSSGGSEATGGGTAGAGGAAGAGAGSSGASGSSGAAGSSALGGSSGAAGIGGDDLAPLSDEFDGADLDPRWAVHGQEHFELVSVTGSALNLVPRESIWWNDESAGLIYQTVTGNFRVSSVMRVSTTLDAAAPPTQRTHWAGVWAGTLGTATNHVTLVLGRDAAEDASASIERSSTVNDVSDWLPVAWSSGWEAELRLCRVGSRITALTRPFGATAWMEQVSYDRPDLPATLEVGLVAYAYFAETPDLLARFDRVDFARVSLPPDCSAD